ncbi:hypothetical protein KKA39_02535, partial [Patescibacteria group bacterium]|nr:hypothetical protein [Patescibacteria group bacterium]MBU1728153.1 hypothetical protein [Patescibacteria group bacterium]
MSAMVGNKLILLKNGQIKSTERILIEIPNLEQVKKFSSKKLRRYGFIALVLSIRIYVKISNILKKIYK